MGNESVLEAGNEGNVFEVFEGVFEGESEEEGFGGVLVVGHHQLPYAIALLPFI